jgi:methionyl aminopeptidase
MISLKNAAQLDKMRASGRLLHQVLTALRPMVVPGATTRTLNDAAHRMITQSGAVPSFLGYNGFPAALCTSVNKIVVHGIPDDRPLQAGEIVGLDCGLILDGWHADSAYTAAVGAITPEAQRLIEVTEQCFWKGAAQAVKGNRIGDISQAVYDFATAHGYQPIRAMCGHGIGRQMHEDPEVPNFFEPGKGKGLRLQPGMTLAIEPMIAAGGWEVDMDNWYIATKDGSLCSNYEHTILITEGAPEVFTVPGRFGGAMA